MWGGRLDSVRRPKNSDQLPDDGLWRVGEIREVRLARASEICLPHLTLLFNNHRDRDPRADDKIRGEIFH